MITLKKWIILQSKDRTRRAEGRLLKLHAWDERLGAAHGTAAVAVVLSSVGKALKLPDSTPKCRSQFWLGPVIQLLKSSACLKSTSWSLIALESDRHSRFLSTSCDWIEDVFFPDTFTPSEAWHGWDVNGKITTHFPLLCLLQMVSCFSVELLKDKKKMV